MGAPESELSAVFAKTARNRIKRAHEDARYERAEVYRILEAGFVCHIGYCIDGQPYATPTAYWRNGDRVFWHGSSAGRMIRALEAMMERIVPGRWPELRPATDQELKATTVLSMALSEAVAKFSEGPPDDEAADDALDIWAGVVPVRLATGAAQDDPRLKPGLAASAYLWKIRLH